ncbi:MAG TPA: calcium-binding protein [Allosphingosinicella sp.]
MATGTQGPDILSNDQSLSNETIDALGGDDRINVRTPFPPGGGNSVTSVTVNGGDGFDTLDLSAYPIYSLSPNSARIGEYATQSSSSTWPADISWSGVERLVVFGDADFGGSAPSSYKAGSWSTGDTTDEITVRVSRGVITLSTGGGNDKIYFHSVADGSVANGGPGDDLIDLSRFPANFVFANGDEGNDIIIGNDRVDTLNGGEGNDQLRSGRGDDLLQGAAGNDVLYFGPSFSSADVADGGADRDSVVLQGNYTLTFGAAQLIGVESISLQSGANTRFGDTANNFYDYVVTTVNGNVSAGQQLIVNASSLRAGEDFTFDGSAESDGRFLVYGGHGVDDLTGGDGADVFFFEGQRWGPGDRVDGGDGADALVISGGSGMTHIEFAAGALTGIEAISLNNRFATDPTQKPSYELVLNNGNVAAGGTLIVNGSSIPGGQQVIIDGRGVHGGNLTLFAGGGHDILTGGDGADLIVGGGGADSLTGGAGADTFRYDAASDSIGLADLIGDFQSGLDRIDLSRIDADANSDGNQAFTWIGSNAFSGSAGELRTYEDGYRWVEGDTDGDGAADLVIVLQVGTPPLVAGDFIL